eukprot:12282793-Ditylum_brightwellii.AAC.1
MALFLVGQFVTLVVRTLNRSITDDALDALVAQGDRQVLKVAHHVHAAVALFDCFFDLVLDRQVEILDLFACQAMLFGLPFNVLYKLDLLELLLFYVAVCGLNVLPAALHKVPFISVIVTQTMRVTKLFLPFSFMTFSQTVTSLVM